MKIEHLHISYIKVFPLDISIFEKVKKILFI